MTDEGQSRKDRLFEMLERAAAKMGKGDAEPDAQAPTTAPSPAAAGADPSAAYARVAHAGGGDPLAAYTGSKAPGQLASASTGAPPAQGAGEEVEEAEAVDDTDYTAPAGRDEEVEEDFAVDEDETYSQDSRTAQELAEGLKSEYPREEKPAVRRERPELKEKYQQDYENEKTGMPSIREGLDELLVVTEGNKPNMDNLHVLRYENKDGKNVAVLRADDIYKEVTELYKRYEESDDKEEADKVDLEKYFKTLKRRHGELSSMVKGLTENEIPEIKRFRDYYERGLNEGKLKDEQRKFNQKTLEELRKLDTKVYNTQKILDILANSLLVQMWVAKSLNGLKDRNGQAREMIENKYADLKSYYEEELKSKKCPKPIGFYKRALERATLETLMAEGSGFSNVKIIEAIEKVTSSLGFYKDEKYEIDFGKIGREAETLDREEKDYELGKRSEQAMAEVQRVKAEAAQDLKRLEQKIDSTETNGTKKEKLESVGKISGEIAVVDEPLQDVVKRQREVLESRNETIDKKNRDIGRLEERLDQADERLDQANYMRKRAKRNGWLKAAAALVIAGAGMFVYKNVESRRREQGLRNNITALTSEKQDVEKARDAAVAAEKAAEDAKKTAEGARAKLQKNYDILEKRQKDAETKIAEAEGTLEGLQSKLGEVQQKLADAEAKAGDLTGKYEDSEKARKAAEEERKRLEEGLGKVAGIESLAEEELGKLKNEVPNDYHPLIDKMASLGAELEKQEAELTEKTNKMETDYQKALADISRLEKEKAELEEGKVGDAVASLREIKRRHEEEIGKIREEREKTLTDLAEAQSRIAELQDELKKAGTAAATQHTVSTGTQAAIVSHPTSTQTITAKPKDTRIGVEELDADYLKLLKRLNK